MARKEKKREVHPDSMYMDLYKWAYKLGPLVPGELLLDCFELARDVRELDMRASPYDLTDLGYSPVCIETTEGKQQYVAAQRDFAARTHPLRTRLIDLCRLATDTATDTSSSIFGDAPGRARSEPGASRHLHDVLSAVTGTLAPEAAP
jgi:hypothetical protein